MEHSETSPRKDWPHAAIHRRDSRGIYMVTAATLHKEHLFVGTDRLDLLEHELLSLAKQYEWQTSSMGSFL
jgi:hypothetical protein